MHLLFKQAMFTQTTFTQIVWRLLWAISIATCLLCNYVQAAKVEKSTTIKSSEKISDTAAGVTAFIYLVAGSCLCFRGSWTIRPLFAVAGLLSTTYASLAFLAWFSYGLNMANNTAVQILILLIALINGVIVALLTTRYGAVGALVTGGMLGCFIAIRLAIFANITIDIIHLDKGQLALNYPSNGHSSSVDATYLVFLITVVMIIAAWLTYLLEPLVVILITTVMGSVWCAMAIDTLCRTNFIAAVTAVVYGLHPISVANDAEIINLKTIDQNDPQFYQDGWEVKPVDYNGGIGGLWTLTVILTLTGMFLQHKQMCAKSDGYQNIRLPMFRRFLRHYGVYKKQY
ncbi:hypothetical protein BDF19DRAFT_439026 [Syncephalis fuscata]|nr:hypothetical protein BDF19DRAFT_439026 [Syncephalis fuscata]